MDSRELWARKRAAIAAWKRGGPCSVCGEPVAPALKGAMSAPDEVWHRECNERRARAQGAAVFRVSPDTTKAKEAS